MSKLRKFLGVLIAGLAVIVNYSAPVTTYSKLPDEIVVRKGEEVDIDFGLPVKYNITNNSEISISSDDDMIMGSTMSASILSNEENPSNVSISALVFPNQITKHCNS